MGSISTSQTHNTIYTHVREVRGHRGRLGNHVQTRWKRSEKGVLVWVWILREHQIFVKRTSLKTETLFHCLERLISNDCKQTCYARPATSQVPRERTFCSLMEFTSSPECAAVLPPLSSHLLSTYIFGISFPAGPSPQSIASPSGFGAIWNYNSWGHQPSSGSTIWGQTFHLAGLMLHNRTCRESF